MRGWVGRAGVVAGLVALVAGSSLPVGAAQEPAATPPADEGVPVVAGMEAVVARVFAASGKRESGTIALAFLVGQFASPEAAAAAWPDMIDLAFAELAKDVDPSALRQTSPPRLGDDAVAFTGPITMNNAPEARGFAAAVLVVRDGPYLHLMVGVAKDGDAYLDLVDVARRTVGRRPNPCPSATDGHGLRADGLWRLLPRLDDLPPGFVLAKEDERLNAPATPTD